ncbi:hypothetical protein [Paenibacillus whitsoniae]|uniref:Uncharacterized protein n=1 Tax=Paenibacillus whitsoniae TaxID=2496558 RepID=A0A430JKJ5_9BACL|nr:hypothetical protein [Paenibacillus whitsoniae]RTE11539.1 hypothetical protein EJQ19_01720 [Paenibacillus whitsoniae]
MLKFKSPNLKFVTVLALVSIICTNGWASTVAAASVESMKALPNIIDSSGNTQQLLNRVTGNVYGSQTKNQIVREVVEQRTSKSKHFLLADGSYQAQISLKDVHYEDENGHWQDIKTDLIDEADLDVATVALSKASAKEVKQLAKDNKDKKSKNQLDRSQTSYRALQIPYDVKIPKQWKQG